MFGENSDSTFGSLTDGSSNTVAMSETLHDVQDGECPAWGYRGWVSTGVDLRIGINRFDRSALGAWYTGPRTSIPGLLYSWGLGGSLHPGGCNVLLGDGSVSFLSESAERTVLQAIQTISNNETVEMP